MNIVIADDHILFRDALVSLIETRGEHQVVGVASDGAAAIELARRLNPDLILMDIWMPGMDGLEATRQLHAELPEIQIVVLTASTFDEDLFEAIKAGADGYLLKDLQADQFFALLDGAARGEPALTPLLARKLLNELRTPSQDQGTDHDPDALTDREQQVLEALVEGVTSNVALAKHLGISTNTVKFHVRNILDKLHLHSRAQAVGYALREGLVESGD